MMKIFTVVSLLPLHHTEESRRMESNELVLVLTLLNVWLYSSHSVCVSFLNCKVSAEYAIKINLYQKRYLPLISLHRIDRWYLIITETCQLRRQI